MARFNDLTNREFGRLKAVERLPPHGKNKAYMWACVCECGGTAVVRGTDLVNGHTMSCGCYRKMQRAMPNGQLRLHRIWANMKQRCQNPKQSFHQCGMFHSWKFSFHRGIAPPFGAHIFNIPLYHIFVNKSSILGKNFAFRRAFRKRRKAPVSECFQEEIMRAPHHDPAPVFFDR